MTWEDYEQVRKTRPELLLPPWWRIAPHFRDHLLDLTLDELVAGRSYTMLSRKDWHIPEQGAEGIRLERTSPANSYKEV